MPPTEPHTTGPHLIAALICEKVLDEKDGVLSAIRIIDRLERSAIGPDAPEEMPPFVVDNLTLLVTVKSDQARGRYGIKVRPEAPGGVQLPPMEQAITIQPGPAGINLTVPFALAIQAEGVYWFDVFLTGPAPQEDRLLTRVPLEVIYSPQRPPST
jgi:hypothetical protein